MERGCWQESRSFLQVLDRRVIVCAPGVSGALAGMAPLASLAPFVRYDVTFCESIVTASVERSMP